MKRDHAYAMRTDAMPRHNLNVDRKSPPMRTLAPCLMRQNPVASVLARREARTLASALSKEDIDSLGQGSWREALMLP
eukprot:6188712-Pleurochrysis_carterae.AAC.1